MFCESCYFYDVYIIVYIINIVHVGSSLLDEFIDSNFSRSDYIYYIHDYS